MSSFTKDPDAILDYVIDWSSWLATGDTIVASTWISSDAALVVDSSSFTATNATAVVSGGDNRRRYSLTNRVTTAAGLVDDRTITIRIAQR